MEELVKAARAVRDKAYAPYSGFKVGAAVLSGSGKIYSGCNVENASYGLTICAERTAVFKAVAEGETEFSALAVVADTLRPTAPCGACRQVMAEFGISKIIMCNTKGEQRVATLDQLLPAVFDKHDLTGDGKC
ncbi:cytidine deaminase|uniref:Cytidine deaminase n=1 Tax=Dendrosporobacter quercicolus TaxID=146817 RepID=A0A1G9MQZ1_9FIRM|nr:cytidine deaminase [Dendrosporobacter quercicolus]NSL47109.1 cytidine deaminase [Dendrosporobacter quercicolus DSM 1736]SDL76524.1 cytidine deaminase [Dendrosporobacter quercicolus]